MSRIIKIVILCSSIFVLGGLLAICIIDCKNVNEITTNFLEYLNQLVTPICLVTGIIVGYPLVKKKLIEGYLSRQFEIMHEANRAVRTECLQLLEKYPVKHISNELSKDNIAECLSDITKLFNISIDANPNAYKYVNIVKNTLAKFYELYPKDGRHSYYIEAFHGFVHSHIKQVYDYARTIESNFDGNLVMKRRLDTKLDKFVHDNQYSDVDYIDSSLNYYHTSQLSVLFFSNSMKSIRSDNQLLYYSFYKALPSPCPMARILYHREIYVPLSLKSTKKVIFGLEQQLSLIGFSARVSSSINGEKKYIYTCHYGNISDFGFVHGIIKGADDLKDFFDAYINSGSIADYSISEFQVDPDAEIISIAIEKSILHDSFMKNKKLLKKKMREEMRKN